jgi:flagellar biosynthesis protein FlhF
MIVDHYLPMGFDHLLFTKWDEAAAPGLIYNMVHKYRRTLSYVTTGQNVPDDMEVADPETITRAILGV